jgi:hypothetical protein
MGAVTVNLPKSHAAVFPTRCIRCGAAGPGSTWQVSTRAIGWWTILFQSSGPRYTVDVPACASCGGQLRRRALARTFLEWALIIVGVGLAMWALGWQAAGWRKWAVLVLGLLALLPLLIRDEFFPPLLDLTAYSETVDFDFRDTGYADEFRKLNEDGMPSAKAQSEPDAASRKE